MAFMDEFQHLKIQLEEIKLATNNFGDSNLIGTGGFGKVYKGEISHSKGRSMGAIKRLDTKLGQGNSEFWREIMMLSRYTHENLVSLLGYCDDGGPADLHTEVYEEVEQQPMDYDKEMIQTVQHTMEKVTLDFDSSPASPENEYMGSLETHEGENVVDEDHSFITDEHVNRLKSDTLLGEEEEEEDVEVEAKARYSLRFSHPLEPMINWPARPSPTDSSE
ncbi:hypothetical protein L6452_32055 [Arctium lappa]|uniref:Uncharacterized protein n=1 Tax=Arctium lappa TaxID=4217 RepID=A0ACB8Z2M9_ARCLA|nr:hypothetical protein L6452_32055 [Arctium lappa]